MKLISRVHVEGFRSVRDTALDNLGDFSVLAGVNNSGKSNLLRALCAFFNGTCDGENQLDLRRDYYRPDYASKWRRKRVRITVSFELPESFKFHGRLHGAHEFVGDSPSITREWAPRGTQTLYLGNREIVDRDDHQKISQFLSLISFRYVPNRVLPVEVIRQEHEALRNVIVRRLSRTKDESAKLFERINDTSQKIVRDISDQVGALGLDAAAVEIASPESPADLLFGLGYRVRDGEHRFVESLQGSGLQSFLMFTTLHLIDQDYFQRWGWKQAAIWAIEEPESSMHAWLEAQTAAWLASVSKSPSGRLQIIASSHSDRMVQYADVGYGVHRVTTGGKKATEVERMEPRQLLSWGATAGATKFIDPILLFPLEPVLLVEGKHDRDFLRRAYGLLERGNFRICCLEDLAVGATGGDDLRHYIKHHAPAIQSRPPDVPVVLLLDWDKRSKVSSYEGLVPLRRGLVVEVWPEDKCNPNLGRTFRGIERFYSDRMVEAAEKKTDAIARPRKGVAIVENNRYGEVKGILAEIVSTDLRAEDLLHAKTFLLSLLRYPRLDPSP